MPGDQHVHPAVKKRLAREHTQAVTAAEEAVASAGATYGDSHPQVAAALSRLARLHQSRSDFDHAEAAFLRALAIREKNPTDSAGLVEELRAVARLYDASGRGDRAPPLMQRAARIEADAFQSGMRPAESAEPEYDARAEFVEEMVGSAPKTRWTELLGGLLVPAGLGVRGLSIIVSGRTAFYGAHGSMMGAPLIIRGAAAVMLGLVWVCGAAFAHFHFFWPYRNRALCSYGKAAAFGGGLLLLLGALARMWMQ